MNYNNNDNGLLLFLFILFLLFSLSMNGQGELMKASGGVEIKSDTTHIAKIGKCRHSQYRLEREGKNRSIYKSSTGETIIITKPPKSVVDSSSTSISLHVSKQIN